MTEHIGKNIKANVSAGANTDFNTEPIKIFRAADVDFIFARVRSGYADQRWLEYFLARRYHADAAASQGWVSA